MGAVVERIVVGGVAVVEIVVNGVGVGLVLVVVVVVIAVEAKLLLVTLYCSTNQAPGDNINKRGGAGEGERIHSYSKTAKNMRKSRQKQ